MANWHNASRRTPCPICNHTDWCTMSDDGMMCVCHRVESPHPAKSGHGWIHVLVETPRRPTRVLSPLPKCPRPVLFNAAYTMDGFRDEFIAGDIFDSLLSIASDLNLAACYVDRLLVGRSGFHNAWAFPMLDGEGKTVGIRLREYGSSRKWSVAGSKDGLFYDPGLMPREAYENGLKGREIVVVEGATDTIAGYALGLPCVGRSSCGTGLEPLKELCKRLAVSRVTIVTDNDKYKVRPSGMPYRPGIEGATKLAQGLGRMFRMVTPPKKDLREWFYSGLSAKTFWMVAGLQPWRLK